jgi:hypothetical protein
MSYQQNQAIVNLFCSVLATIIYTYYLLQKIGLGDFDPTILSSYWGKLVLVVIAVQIVITIILSILTSIIKAIVTRDTEPTLTDERDRLFDLRSTQITFVVFTMGFLIAMITLAIGRPIFVMFNLIVYSLFAATTIGHITQLYYYRRGY